MDSSLIYQGNNIIISQCIDCDIPGYMIISFDREVFKISDLNQGEQLELLEALAYTEEALIFLFHPEKIYIMRLSEANNKFHFHIFPRYSHITELYLKSTSKDSLIDGALFFSWARNNFKTSSKIFSEDTLNAISLLKKYIFYLKLKNQ